MLVDTILLVVSEIVGIGAEAESQAERDEGLGEEPHWRTALFYRLIFMDRQLHTKCKAVTRSISEDPLAKFFFENPFSDKKLLKAYEAKVKNFVPIDLPTVKRRLNSASYYQSMQAWADDMRLIFRQTIEFYKQDGESAIGGVAKYLLKQLEKKIRDLEATNLRNYEHQLIQLGRELEDAIKNMPAAFSIDCNYAGLDPSEDGKFTVERIMRLKNSVEQIVRDGREAEIIAILKETEPGTLTREVDFGHLGRRSLLALEEFVRNQ